jgi:hypothetical protein
MQTADTDFPTSEMQEEHVATPLAAISVRTNRGFRGRAGCKPAIAAGTQAQE